MAKLADFFLYDLKFIDDAKHRQWTGASNELVLKNLKLLAGGPAAIYLRLILVGGLNDSDADIDALIGWLVANEIPAAEVNLLPYHRFGQDKAVKLGRPWREFATPDDDTVANIRQKMLSIFPRVTIGG
jgi:pyruvate formate lyase activating enzyme